MKSVCTFATSVLNQWALDFDGNYRNIIESIEIAKLKKAKYRAGPELEITGYGCGDHFYESDTLLHSWEVMKMILENQICRDIILDIGMPIGHRGAVYNCRVILLNGNIILIRPKQVLANKEVFRESRWFTSWQQKGVVENYLLPDFIQEITGQKYVPFGDALLCLNDTVIAIETCEELWSQHAPNIDYYLNGAEIIFNGNGSNHILRKLDRRLNLIQSACKKIGGVYAYTNLRGCDGERIYYDGGALIAVNGEIVGQSEQFSLQDVEVLVATVDLEEVRTYRYCSSNYSVNIDGKNQIHRIPVDFSLTAPFLYNSNNNNNSKLRISRPINPTIIPPEKEISLAPALWLWDNLRRSKLNGFFLPLSGGLDSSSVACIVYSMCIEIVKSIKSGNARTLADIRQVVGDQNYVPINEKELCSKILVTCYMGSENSSQETRTRAKCLSVDINSSHIDVGIDQIVSAFIAVVLCCFGTKPNYKANGGSNVENLALQNVQARIRMVLAYLLSQLYLWSKNRSGGLLVLASGNLDECLRGYLTKYDCSSADLNPIGSICKTDLKMFISYSIKEFKLESLASILSAPPTAELEPLKDGKVCQTDEVDMGMTYSELSEYGKLRKVKCCGPFGMFVKLLEIWKDKQLTPSEIAEKVRHFFICYSKNRHKMTIITPSYHVESYNCDDNRFDLRPYLYNVAWTWQFNCIDKLASDMEKTCF